MGLAIGSSTTALTLSFSPSYLIVGGMIGMLHSVFFTKMLRFFMKKKYLALKAEEKYVDRDFKLV